MDQLDYQLALFAGVLGIAGTVLGTLLTYRLAQRLARQQFKHMLVIAKRESWHAAARDLVSTLAPDLEALNAVDAPTDLRGFLKQAYADHQRDALARFQHHLDPALHKSFRADWSAYCFGQGADGKLLLPNVTGLSEDQSLFLYCEEPGSELSPSPRHHTAYAATKLDALLSYGRLALSEAYLHD